jgi:hypothetical protein
MRILLPLLALAHVLGCSENNESRVSADYASLRVNRITLSDRQGKAVVTLSAEAGSNGVPRLILKAPGGTTLRTIELTPAK